MKSTTNLFGILLLIGMAACATSHRERAIENESAEASIMSGELEAQFTTDYVSEDLLDALEVRAQQKLLDFADYVTLIGNSTIDSTFRQQAQEQAHHLFIHPETTVRLEKEALSLKDFFSAIQQGEESLNYTVKNVEVAQPLQQESDQKYTGSLTFFQPATIELSEVTYQRVVKIWVKKVDKQFGSEQKQVWEVFLGNIK